MSGIRWPSTLIIGSVSRETVIYKTHAISSALTDVRANVDFTCSTHRDMIRCVLGYILSIVLVDT